MDKIFGLKNASRWFHTLGAEILRHNAQKINFPVDGTAPTLVDAANISHPLSIGGCTVADLIEAILARSALWPELSDNIFATNQRHKRVLLTMPKCSIQMDVVSPRPQEKSEFVLRLENIKHDESAKLWDRLTLSNEQQPLLQHLVDSPFGLVLVGTTPKVSTIDTAHIVAAMHPEAVILPTPLIGTNLSGVISLAESALVLVRLGGDDPVEALLESLNLAENDAMRSKICSLVRGVFVGKRVRRVCTTCAKSSAVSSQLANKIPSYLLPPDESTYMFGRGCEKCGHSSYRGTINIETVLWVDKEMRAMLDSRSGTQKITDHAYHQGTRTLLEDGLIKIAKGLSSFEEVCAQTTAPSAAFARVITTSRHQIWKKPGATPDPKDDGAIDVDFFSETTEAPVNLQPAKKDPNKKPALLIVEDDSDQREVLAIVFRKEGYDVEEAESGNRALKLLEEKRIDCIICDLMMPGMSGEDLVKQVRENKSHKKIPILMLTAVTSEDKEYEVLACGADDFCSKTVQRKILLKRVEKLLSRKQGNPVEHLLGE